jgi:hypothetical protein
MSILLTIDSILSLPVVRWMLLAATVAALVTATWCKLQIGTVRLQRDAAQGQNASLAASLSVQNDAIKKQGDAMQQLLKKVKAANAEAEILRQNLLKRKTEIREIILTGPCENMVQQTIDEVRKDAK